MLFIKGVFEQVKTILTSCGFSKHALGVEIYKEINDIFSQFKASLTAKELTLLSLD
jgi:hypothetical protein